MRSLSYIKKSILSFLYIRGIRIARVTNIELVTELIRKLHPIEAPLVRIGGEGDGGYLVPDELQGIKTCFSPGVSTNSSFEYELSIKYDIKSYLADFSVESPTLMSKNFDFIKKYIGSKNSAYEIVFEDWILTNSIKNEDLILQMDIEGGEYENIISLNPKVLKQFRILIIEFHNLELLLDAKAFPILESCFLKILEFFSVVHIHPNNNEHVEKCKTLEIPRVLEFTFLRKDFLHNEQFETKYPNPLDKTNNLGKSDILLPKCWYRN